MIKESMKYENQANSHKVQGYPRSWKDKILTRIGKNIILKGPFNATDTEYHLSGENRVKLLSVGTIPARSLYDTFLQKRSRIKSILVKTRHKQFKIAFLAVNLQDIETEAVSKWQDISSNTIIF